MIRGLIISLCLTGTIQLVGDEPPNLVCKTLSSFDPSDWKSVEAAFKDATPVAMWQAWHNTPDPTFKPATIRTGRRGNSLWIYAQVEDVSINDRATRLNEMRDIPPDLKPGQSFDFLSTTCGDVFEIFLRRSSQKDYFELHVTPQNQALQLHWAGAQDYIDSDVEDVRESKRQIAKRVIPPPKAFTSHTRVDEKNQTWHVLAEVPAGLLDESVGITNGEVWRFSFSRYDFTKGNDVPIVSSTSLHKSCNFHCQEEWGQLHFSKTDKPK